MFARTRMNLQQPFWPACFGRSVPIKSFGLKHVNWIWFECQCFQKLKPVSKNKLLKFLLYRLNTSDPLKPNMTFALVFSENISVAQVSHTHLPVFPAWQGLCCNISEMIDIAQGYHRHVQGIRHVQNYACFKKWLVTQIFATNFQSCYP